MMEFISGVVIDHETGLSFEEIASATHVDEEFIIQLIEYHIVHPHKGTSKKNWQFDHLSLRRLKLARNFYYDLEVNLSGIALLMDMSERIEQLEIEMEKFKTCFK